MPPNMLFVPERPGARDLVTPIALPLPGKLPGQFAPPDAGVVRVRRPEPWQPLPHQTPPPGDWDVWMLVGGRGSGKTRAGVEYVIRHLREHGARARVGIGAPTRGDARDYCAEGQSGLITLYGDEFLAGGKSRYNRSIGEAYHQGGGYVRFLGSEDPERWNGPQWSLLWPDELWAWNWESWEQAQFGLRLGDHPRAIVTTTPKGSKRLRGLAAQAGTVVTSATTYDNPYLPEHFKRRVELRYGGTRLGRQELLGQFVDDVEGALWRRQWIEDSRVAAAPALTRVVVGIDPAGGSGKPHTADTGICVAGKGVDGQFYVLHGEGVQLSPFAWADRAVSLFDEHQADRIIAERNYGGPYVEATLRAVRPGMPLTMVSATRGKSVRAEPIAALYEQCLAAGTLVATARGLMPIEQVTTADQVWTRAGLRPVRWSGQTGTEATLRLRGQGLDLTCTASHPVHTQRGFIRAGQLVPNSDTITAWYDTPVPTVESPLPSPLVAAARAPRRSAGQRRVSQSARSWSSRARATFARAMATIARVGSTAMPYFTVLFGSQLTAQSPRAGISTTSTTIQHTTSLKTSRRLLLRRTAPITARVIPPPLLTLEPISVSADRSGGRNVNPSSGGAITAVQTSLAEQRAYVSALRPVTRRIGLQNVEPAPRQAVYNLDVADQPEFFANGVLVHNCKVHHVGMLADLEDQMCSFPIATEKKDMVDALVWALTELSDAVEAGSWSDVGRARPGVFAGRR